MVQSIYKLKQTPTGGIATLGEIPNRIYKKFAAKAGKVRCKSVATAIAVKVGYPARLPQLAVSVFGQKEDPAASIHAFRV